MGRTADILDQLPSYFDINDSEKLFWALLDAWGKGLDDVDGDHEDNERDYAVVTALGEALDAHATFYSLVRYAGESDDDLRARILSSLGTMSGTRASIEDAVAAFVDRANILIHEYGRDSWVLGRSVLGRDTVIRQIPLDAFNFEVRILNSSGVSTTTQNRIVAAVVAAKMAGTNEAVFFV